MRTGTLFGLLAGGGVAILAGSAHATLIQYQFSGAVYAIVDDEHELDEIVHLGDVCTATWVFDIETPDLDPLSLWGKYEGLSATLTLPAFSTSAGGQARVYDSSVASSPDSLGFDSLGSESHFFSGYLRGVSDVVFSDDALPIQIQASDFPERAIGFWANPGSGKFFASVDSVVVTAVPEPGTLILALLGLLGAGKGAARRF